MIIWNRLWRAVLTAADWMLGTHLAEWRLASHDRRVGDLVAPDSSFQRLVLPLE